jgi:PTH1 family peptidyl-tRNA hydrolase
MGSEESTTWLLVGLGNPGRLYEGTYHNVGRVAAAGFAAGRAGFDGRWGEKFKGLFAKVDAGEGVRVLVLLPETYMNLSGEAAAQAAGMFKVEPGNIIVVHDDLDLEPGHVRVKVGGGDGGHRGVASCILLLGSADFVRVRIGIGKDPEWDGADYVLSRIRQEHVEPLRDGIARAAAAIETIITRGVRQAMNEFNRRQKKENV